MDVGSADGTVLGAGLGAKLGAIVGLSESYAPALVGDSVGTSFRQWPAEMAFISPSFNQQVPRLHGLPCPFMTFHDLL